MGGGSIRSARCARGGPSPSQSQYHHNAGDAITQGTPAALAAKQATTVIPIVMAIVGDPVPTVVSSYSRPGGNITAASAFFRERSRAFATSTRGRTTTPISAFT